MRFFQLAVAAAILLPVGAQADTGQNELGVVLWFGLLPLGVSILVLIVHLLVSGRPWLHKAGSAVAFAMGLLLVLILFASRVVELPVYGIPLVWLVPSGLCILVTRRLRSQ